MRAHAGRLHRQRGGAGAAVPVALSEPFAARWGRRGLTLGGYGFAAVLVWGALPALLALALLVGLARRIRLAASRALAFLAGYLACEAFGLLASLALWTPGGTWLRGPPTRSLTGNFRLQLAWAKTLLGLARHIYGCGSRPT